MTELNHWWQKTTIYQIYPRSFKDTNNDGIGDLKGIISKLDYIKDLGHETIWISPFYKSPQKDHGYDINDYYSIEPDYGTLNDALLLIDEVHKRGMKILFDMVLNHTSIEHPWFQESRSSRSNPKRDWYIWKDGRGENPPNNWKSMVGKNGWNYDNTTGQWYYSNFLPFQPDLNFNNPAVKNEMFNIMRFWLEKGVDGFRLDIFNSIYKDESYRDNPFSFRYVPTMDNHYKCYFQKKIYNYNHPKNFKLAKEIRALIDSYSPERMLIGEVSGRHEVLKKFFGQNHDGLNLLFMFETVAINFRAEFFKEIIRTFEKSYPYPYIPTFVYSNHDVMRSISKVANDHEKAKCLALFQLTARGVPVVYYGEEIGMTDADMPSRYDQDPIAGMYRRVPKKLADMFKVFINRDRSRTPMQWDSSVNSGFTGPGVKTWLPVNDDYKDINVKTQIDNPESLFNSYKKILSIRNSCQVFREGSLRLIDEKNITGCVLVFERSCNDESAVVIINFSSKKSELPNIWKTGNTLYKTQKGIHVGEDKIIMPSCSGLILSNFAKNVTTQL